jgi:peroxiredoxin
MKLSFFSLLICWASVVASAQEKPLGLNLNDTAPDFTAKDQAGKEINLKKLLKKGPVVVLFYRGQWCPFCNKQLSGMQDSLAAITSKGATVVAITPEKPENIAKTIEKTKASYSLLFDDGLKIMKSYKVAFEVDAVTIEKYKGYGIDFNVANGTNGANLPVPAVYIISKKGKIAYRHFDPDYRKRPSVKEIASHL